MNTPFQQALQQVKDGTLQAPKVSVSGGEIDYFGYQLTVHKHNLKIMSIGMKIHGVKYTDIKNYYGLKARSAKDGLAEFEKIFSEYKASLV